nr:MAG TPA: hypothetical protein [Caudoviricetes sp.]
MLVHVLAVGQKNNYKDIFFYLSLQGVSTVVCLVLRQHST